MADDSMADYSAFSGFRLLASGRLAIVLAAARRSLDEKGGGPHDADILIFEHASGRQVDFDFRGTVAEVLSRAGLDAADAEAGSEPADFVRPGSQAAAAPGRGRPRLGVVPGEVTLLPRHWSWLTRQPKRASGTIRRLVEEAMQTEARDPATRLAPLGNLLWSLAGNLAGFEEATRALYAVDTGRLCAIAETWPGDLPSFVRGWCAPVDGPEGAAPAAKPHGGPLVSVGPARPAAAPEPAPLAASAADEPWRLGAAEAAALIASGELRPTRLVDAFLERVAEAGPRTNAIVELWDEEARDAARDIEARLGRGETLGPLAGLPFTVKANIDVAGRATTHGVPALARAVAAVDAPVVARLRGAGAIPLGRSNLPDLSLRFHTASSLYGATRNPWNESLSPGGSSGGEGAAIGSGQSALGLGNDAGGSVRIPALFGGVAALKPSSGRFPSDRSVGPRDEPFASQVIPVEGLLARSVADLDLAFGLLSGPDPRDPRALPAPLRGPEPPRPTRVALSLDPGGAGVHPAVVRALETAAEALAQEGYEVERADPPRYAETLAAYGTLVMTEFAATRALLDKLLGAEGRRYIELAMTRAAPTDLQGYLKLTAVRQGLQRDWASFFAERPLLLCPVFLDPAAATDADIRSEETHRRVAEAMGLCSATSFVGLPAVAVPVGLSEGREPDCPAGIPLGVQLVAGFFREDLCLAAAAAIERRLGRIAIPR